METMAAILVSLCGFYLAIGAAFAVPFVLRWAGKNDEAAARGSVGFRLTIFAGAVLLWPVLLAGSPRGGPSAAGLRRWHGRILLAVGILVPVVFAWALLSRPAAEPPRVELPVGR